MIPLHELNLARQIYFLKEARKLIKSGQETFICNALIVLFKLEISQMDYLQTYIPKFNRNYAIEICRKNHISLPNSRSAWWRFSKIFYKWNEYSEQIQISEFDYDRMKKIRLNFLSCLIIELQKELDIEISKYTCKDNSFLLPDNMKKLGFELTKKPENGYYAYQNDGTKHYNKDYHNAAPESKGKVLLYVNLSDYSKKNPFVGIKQDCGSRTVYNGICSTEEFLIQLLNQVR